MTPNMLHEIDEKVLSQHWDVIIIGTGMGGTTIGYSLAKSGKRLIFSLHLRISHILYIYRETAC